MGDCQCHLLIRLKPNIVVVHIIMYLTEFGPLIIIHKSRKYFLGKVKSKSKRVMLYVDI